MKSSLPWVALAVSLGFVLVAVDRFKENYSSSMSAFLRAFGRGQLTAIQAGNQWNDDGEERVLVNNKCKCVTVTSKFVPSKDNPEEEVLERNIRIIVPLKSRQNISDPTSPLRTNFVYRMTELCKKCDPTEIELGGEIYQAQQSNSCNEPETCYTYDREKCYTTTIPFVYHGETKQIQAALTPTSCYAD